MIVLLPEGRMTSGFVGGKQKIGSIHPGQEKATKVREKRNIALKLGQHRNAGRLLGQRDPRMEHARWPNISLCETGSARSAQQHVCRKGKAARKQVMGGGTSVHACSDCPMGMGGSLPGPAMMRLADALCGGCCCRLMRRRSVD